MAYLPSEQARKKEIIAVLDTAKALIKKGGLEKRRPESATGGYCMLGAIHKAAATLSPGSIDSIFCNARQAVDAVAMAIVGRPEHLLDSPGIVIKYNDNFWRMKWQALRKMEEAKAFV